MANKETLSYNLPLLDRFLASSAHRVQFSGAVIGFIIFLLSWLWLLLQSAGSYRFIEGATLGPGMEFLHPLLDSIADRATGSFWLESFLRFCLPQSSLDFSNLLRDFFGLFTMWFAMSMAMMLPSTASMFRTYADIAHVAREGNHRTSPLYVLALGYAFSWMIFCIFVSVLQLYLLHSGFLDFSFGSSYSFFSSLILIFAGFYQFSSLKDICLVKCRSPFRVLFSRWRGDHLGVFRLGMDQGFYCIGCCWTLMLVLFVVGVMNLVWMLFFTLFSLIEKGTSSGMIGAIVGLILLIWGFSLLWFSVGGYYV